MKKVCLILLVFVLFAGISCTRDNRAPAVEELPVITIVNDTGYDFYYLFVSSSKDEDWGDDLLGMDILLYGESFEVTLPHPLTAENLYDIMVIDEDDDSFTKFEVDVSANNRIVFTIEDLDDDYYY
jgi:hypothetical protein